jgi:beta-glucosidase
MKGFNAYEIRDGKVRPAVELKKLYEKFPGCGLSSFFRADWYSGRNWKTGLRPEMLIKAYNAMQRYAVEKTRLGIPLTLAGGQMLGETSIPTGIGIASTWDVDLAREAARMNVRELRTFQQNYRVGFPQGTLALDPRWSRVEQTYGEDPFLAAEFVYARCAGSRDLGGGSVLESFICHGMGEGGHMSTPVHVGMNELLNVHMRPFEYAIKGGCSQFMTSYNLVDGIPALLRGDLVNGFVREKLGYKGTFIADAGAIGSLRWQGFARDLGEAAALAVKAGNDLCCWEAENYLNGLMQAIERRLITEEDINVSLRRVLRRRFESGLFEHPYIDPEARAKEYGRPEDVIGCPANRAVALELARKSMTLLENKGGVLPLDPKTIRRIAVIGPNADKPENQLGDYTAPQQPGQTITPRLGFEALSKKYGFEVEYALGCKVRSMNKSGFAAAIEAVKRSDAVVVCLGSSSVPDHALTQNEAGTAICNHIRKDSELDKDCGEGFDRAFLRLNGVQLELLREVRALGKPVVVVLITGRPLVLEDVAAASDAILLAWYPGTEGGTAIAETILGLNNPGGKLPISFPRAEGAIPCFYHALRDRGNYVDCEGGAAYPFGYGLSYTSFSISKPVLDGAKVTVKVTNAGSRRGDEVVQMYIRDVIFSVARPLWELRGFKRVTLAPGASETLTFTLTEKELGFWNREQEYVVEPGQFVVGFDNHFSNEGLRKRAVTYSVKESKHDGQ